MDMKLKYLYGLTEDIQNPEFKDIFNELCNCIKNISDQEIRLEFDKYCNETYKNYPELPKTTKPNKSPAKIINKQIKKSLRMAKWKSEEPIFYKKGDKNLENKIFESLKMDFAKEPFAVEVSFNHGEAMEHNLLKPFLACTDHLGNRTRRVKGYKIGVIIVPTEEFKKNMNLDNTVSNFDKWKSYFDLYSELRLIPYVLIGLKPLKTFIVKEERLPSVQEFSKKTGKPLKLKPGKLIKVWTEDL